MRISQVSSKPSTTVRASVRGGAAAVEFAVLSLPLFILIIGSLEFGRAFMIQERLNFVARTGARLAARDASWGTSGSGNNKITYEKTYDEVASGVNSALSAAGITPADVTKTLQVGKYNSNTATWTWTTITSNTDWDTVAPGPGDAVRLTLSVNYSSVAWMLPARMFLSESSQFRTTCTMRRELA